MQDVTDHYRELQDDSIIELKKGDILTLDDDTEITVSEDNLLGHGGQGSVYCVVDSNNTRYALKWIKNKNFFKKNNKKFYNNILNLSKDKAVRDGRLKAFALPLKLTKVKPNGQFGYIMDIIPPHMVPLGKILNSSKNFEFFNTELDACFNMCDAFCMLHSYNTIFTDINDGSIFFNPNTGEVKICDCDNIVLESEEVTTLGKLGFMAPEVHSGQKCTKYSDRYSLAVLLYWIIFRDDPFIGSILKKQMRDEEENEKAYFKEAIFTMDPDKDQNRPDDKIIKNWEKVPGDIRELFQKTFTAGFKDKMLRPTPNEWKGAIDTWKTTVKSDPFRLLDMDPVPKKIQYVIFIVDSSLSMCGQKMNDVNEAIEECVSELKNLEKENNQIHFEISILQFSDECSWYTDKLSSDINNFIFEKLKPTGTFTRFDKVCKTLDNEFNESGFFKTSQMYKRPFMLLISDGAFSRKRYIDYLKEFRTNQYFKKSHKYAIGVDNEKSKASFEMLADFTGTEKNVTKVNDVKGELGKLITNLTITFSSLSPDDPHKDSLMQLSAKD